MGNVQANAKMSDMVYASSEVLDCTLLKNEDAVVLVTKEGIEISGITGNTNDRSLKFTLPLETEITFARIIRFGYKQNERICVVTGDKEGNIRFFNPGKANLILKLPCASMSAIPGEGHEGRITALEKLENDYIATGGIDGTVRVWEANKGIQERIYVRPDYIGKVAVNVPGVTALCYCPPSALAAYSSSSFSASLAVAYTDGQIWVYGVSEGDHSAIVLTTASSAGDDDEGNKEGNITGSFNLIKRALPAISLSYLSNEMILGAATGEKLLVWNMRFAIRSSEYKNIESNGMYYNLPIAPLSSISMDICRISLFGTYTLAGPWPETPIMLAGCNNGHVSAWALSDTPEFGRCEIIPIHDSEGFAIFSGPISVLRNNSSELQSVIVASGSAVVILAQQVVAGGLSVPALTANAVVDENNLNYTDLDENGNPIRNPNNIVVPLPKNNMEEEIIAYIDAHPECLDAYLELLRALSYKLHDGVKPITVEGIIDEPQTPGKLLDEATARLARVFQNFELSMPPADGSRFAKKNEEEEALQSVVKLIQNRISQHGNNKQESDSTQNSTITQHGTSSASVSGKNLAPIVDASTSYTSSSYSAETVKKIANAALNIEFLPMPEENASYEKITKTQSEDLYLEAVNTGKRLEKKDKEFAKKVDDLCHVSNRTSQDDSDATKDIDVISCLLNESLGIKRLDRTEEYMLNYLKEKHRQELSMHDERMNKKIKETEERFDGERRFWAARFNLALEFHRILRIKAAEHCKESIYNAIVKSLPNGTVSGSRYVTLPLYENPLDFEDKTESKEEPACLLYPAFDLKERKIVASRLVPAGVVSKDNLSKFSYKYLLPCLDISPSISDNHQEYVITEVPPTMNLLKGFTNKKCILPQFTEQAAARFIYKVIESMASLIGPSTQVVHRDLKPSTVMMRYRGGKQVKLRCSKQQEKGEEEENDSNNNANNQDEANTVVPIADNIKFKKLEPVIFTVGFMRGPILNDPVELNTIFSAPEVICGSITKTSDIWSIALILIKMLQKPASECRNGEYPRESPIFTPVGVSPEVMKRWDVVRPEEVSISLLTQMLTFCTDIPYSPGEFPTFIAMAFLEPLKLKDQHLIKYYNFLTGKNITDVDLRFAIQEYHSDLARGITVDSFMINAGVAPPPDAINPNLRSLLSSNINEETLRLLSECLSFFPTKRPTFEKLLRHKWFKDNGVKIDHELALRASGRSDKDNVTKDGVVIGSHMSYADKADGRI